MIKQFSIFFFFIIFSFNQVLFAQPGATVQGPSTFVIVHGAWGGSWAFKRVDSMLTAKGVLVYRPSLTGQGERVHLASPEVGLKTHINDVVNMILFEELNNVVLIGHSYGGMVVTGVADSIPGRIKKMIYLDAMVPENGESVSLIMNRNISSNSKDGFINPSWVRAGQLPPKDVPQSLKTFTEPIQLKQQQRIKLPSVYILTVAKGTDPAKDDFASQAERAKKRGWQVMSFESDHNPQWSAPKALVDLLFSLK